MALPLQCEFAKELICSRIKNTPHGARFSVIQISKLIKVGGTCSAATNMGGIRTLSISSIQVLKYTLMLTAIEENRYGT